MTKDTPPAIPESDPAPVPGAGCASGAEGPSPTLIDRYQVLGELGRGGMGTVYRVRDPSLNTDLALKIVHLPPSQDGWELDRFQREAAVMARLQHPGIVRLLDSGLWHGKPYLVMELVEGETLAAKLGREPISPRQLANVVRQLALALEYAHGCGVVHRDLKPANVLLAPVERVNAPGLETATVQARLTDFGMASDRSAKHQLTVTGEIMGTPAYMAPEQALGDRDQQGPWTDVHGLGTLLYVGLCGRAPYAAANHSESLKRVISGAPPPPSTFRSRLPPLLEALALSCLSTEPHHRPSGVRQVAASLGRFLDGLTVDLDEHVPAVVSVREPTPRWPLALAAAVIVIAAGVATWVVRDVRARSDEQVASTQLALQEVEQKAGRLSQEAAQARAELAARRAEAEERDRKRVQAVDAALARVRAGEVKPDSQTWDDLILSLLRFSGPVLVERLSVPVKEVTAELAEVTRQLYLGVVEPSDDKRKISGKRLTELEELVVGDLWPIEEEDPRLTAVQKAWMKEAGQRITDRDRMRRDRLGEGPVRSRQQIFAAAQTQKVSSSHLRVARFCGGVIALSGEPELGGPVLRAYLVAEWDEGRAVTMTPNFMRLLDESSVDDVRRFGFRFEDSGVYGTRILGVIDKRQDSKQSVSQARVRAMALVQQAQELVQQGQLAQALPALNRALELEPRFALALSLRGLVGHLLGHDVGDVTVDSNRGVELDRTNYMCLYIRGRIRFDRRDWQGAVEDLSKSLEQWPGHGEAWYLRGRARHQAGDLPGAEQDFAKAVELRSERWESWDSLGVVRLDRKDWEGARVALEKARELNARAGADRSGALLANLSMAYGKLERYLDSEKALDEALELLPDNDLLWHNRGDRRFSRGDFAGAQADFSRAIELRPNLAAAFLGRGICWLRLGDLEAARADFQRCLDLNARGDLEAKARLGLAEVDQRTR